MVVGKAEAVRSLCRKSFVDSPEPGKDHRRLGYMWEGRIIFYTYVSHGSGKDIGDDLISDMARQCHLRRQQFVALAKCWMSAEKYRQILIDKGIIPAP
jgi:hypothetical protein